MEEECDIDQCLAVKMEVKHDLQNILIATKFCGLCLKTAEEMSYIKEQFEILIHEQILSVSLHEIISTVFKDVYNILTSNYTCKKCIDNLLQSYKFIENTRAVTKTMYTYIDDMCNKVTDIADLIKSSVRLESSVVIVLDNIDQIKTKRDSVFNSHAKVNGLVPDLLRTNHDSIFNSDLEENCLVTDQMKTIHDSIFNSDSEEYEPVKDQIETNHDSVFNSDSEEDSLIDEIKVKNKQNDLENLYVCDGCKLILPSLKKLEIHQLKYHHKELQCKFCSKGFMSVNYLNVHYKTHSAILCKICHEVLFHSRIVRHLKDNHKDSVYFCSVCNTVCYSVTALEAHMNISHKETVREQCIMCLRTFDDKLSHRCKFRCPECTEMPCMHYKYLIAYRQQILNKETKISCTDCDYVCTKKYSLLGHVNKEHLNHHAYSCNHCPQEFYSKILLKAHIKSLHMEQYRCEYCDSEFSRKKNCDDHRETCRNLKRKFACDKCEANFESSKKLAEHVRVKHCKDVFPCKICGKKLLTESKRKEHFTRVHTSMDILNVKCGLCDAAFDSKRTMQLHMKRHGDNMIYRCKICNADFDKLRKLRVHARRHTSPKVTCKICGRVTRDIYMKRHLETHLPPKIYSCGACGKSLKGIKQYKYHIKHHLIRVPCPDCKLVMHPASLRRHRLSRHTDAPASIINKPKKKLRCQHCNFTTTNRTVMECHTNRHHRKVKPYICHVCSKDFTGRHLLRRHIERHNTEKSVTCRLCSKTFANGTCLKMHLRLHTGENPYTCDICGLRFRSSSIMNFHKETKHCDKNTPCPICNNKFHTIREMRSHVVRVHWKHRDKRFDPRDLKELDPKYYHLFHDGRRSIILENDLEFCISPVLKSQG